jgi:hypothetical protein
MLEVEENAATGIELQDAGKWHRDPVTASFIIPKTWLLIRSDGALLARHARLLASGHIGGCNSIDARRWEVANGRLVFLDGLAREAVVFESNYATVDGMAALRGAGRDANDETYVLREREPLSRIAEDACDTQILTSGRQGRRPNLVVLRANEQSLHHTWQQDIAAEERNWDLCISFYGKEDRFSPTDFAEYHVIQNREQKFAALHKLLYRDSPFWDYQHVMFPDDDLMMSWSSINRLFETSRCLGLHLAQPSLLAESVGYHKIVFQNKGFRLRFTNFVEIMTPIFSRTALEVCVPTFANSPRGFGLDLIWPFLLGDQPCRIAIIDEVGVLHDRPLGANYDVAQGHQEMIKVLGDYGCSWNIRACGALL